MGIISFKRRQSKTSDSFYVKNEDRDRGRSIQEDRDRGRSIQEDRDRSRVIILSCFGFYYSPSQTFNFFLLLERIRFFLTDALI